MHQATRCSQANQEQSKYKDHTVLSISIQQPIESCEVQLTPGRFSPVEQGLPGKPSGVDPPSAMGAPATMVAVEKRIAAKDRRSFIFALGNVVFGKEVLSGVGCLAE
jgi:hypothetical protein